MSFDFNKLVAMNRHPWHPSLGVWCYGWEWYAENRLMPLVKLGIVRFLEMLPLCSTTHRTDGAADGWFDWRGLSRAKHTPGLPDEKFGKRGDTREFSAVMSRLRKEYGVEVIAYCPSFWRIPGDSDLSTGGHEDLAKLMQTPGREDEAIEITSAEMKAIINGLASFGVDTITQLRAGTPGWYWMNLQRSLLTGRNVYVEPVPNEDRAVDWREFPTIVVDRDGYAAPQKAMYARRPELRPPELIRIVNEQLTTKDAGVAHCREILGEGDTCAVCLYGVDGFPGMLNLHKGDLGATIEELLR